MKLIEKCEFNGAVRIIHPDVKCVLASLTGLGGCLFRTFCHHSRQSIPVIQYEMTNSALNMARGSLYCWDTECWAVSERSCLKMDKAASFGWTAEWWKYLPRKRKEESTGSGLSARGGWACQGKCPVMPGWIIPWGCVCGLILLPKPGLIHSEECKIARGRLCVKDHI